MPPKSASAACPSRRSTRFTAVKSTLNPNSPIPINFPSPSSAAAATAIPATPEPSHPVKLSNTGKTPNYQIHPQSSQKTLVPNSGKLEPGIDRVTANSSNADMLASIEPPKTAIENFGPEKTIHVESESVVASGNEAKNEANLLPTPVKAESSIQSVAGPESGATGVAGSGNGKRKVVKKTVRVVKRTIVRRVPKKVVKSCSENQESVEGIAGNGQNSSDVTGKPNVVDEVTERACTSNDVGEESKIANELTESSNLANDVNEKSNLAVGVTVAEESSLVNEVMGKSNIEKSNLMNGVTEKVGLVIEVNEKSSTGDEVTETSLLDNGVRLSEPIVIKKDNDLNEIDSMETEASTINSSQCVSESMIGEKGNDLSCIVEMETSTFDNNTSNDQSNDVMTGADINDISACFPDSMEVEKVNYADEVTTENQSTKKVGDSLIKSSLEESVVVNQPIVNKEEVGLVHDQKVGPVGNIVLVGEENASLIGEPETEIGKVESVSVGLHEGLLLSDEMEALERQKRRKTQIFVGGLDKDAKEKDIRKAFEVAGKVVDVTLVMNGKTGKNKGFAFVRFATAANAKNALEKYSKVKIRGKQCGVSPVEGNDTIFLGNIDRIWKTEDVIQLLEKAGIEKIDKVTLKADPNDIEKNRGFAYVEFETSKDAQFAFSKLQNINVFGKNLKIRVAWAEPLVEPDEKEILKVKSVYAEYLPSSWDEGKVKEYFNRFGEIEKVVLAKDLHSSRRKDFAFINYTTRDAALTCIETVNREQLEDDGSKVKMKVSLSKPLIKTKLIKHSSDLTSKQLSKEKPASSQATIMLHEYRHIEKPASSSYDRVKFDSGPSTTNELVQILRQQASSANHIPPHQTIGTTLPEYHFPAPGSKRPFSHVGHNPLYLEPRGLPRGRIESSYPIPAPSVSSHGVSMQSFPYHHHQVPGSTSEPANARNIYPSRIQTREQQQAPYHGNNSIYRRY